MIGHTKGPWRAAQTKGWGDDWCIEADAYGTRPLAKAIPHPDVYYQQVRKTIRGEEFIVFDAKTEEGEAIRKARELEAEANARLIAASPCLLEALEAALDGLKRASRQLTDDHKIVLNGKQWGGLLIENAEAAIAKARGEA